MIVRRKERQPYTGRLFHRLLKVICRFLHHHMRIERDDNTRPDPPRIDDIDLGGRTGCQTEERRACAHFCIGNDAVHARTISLRSTGAEDRASAWQRDLEHANAPVVRRLQSLDDVLHAQADDADLGIESVMVQAGSSGFRPNRSAALW